MNCVKRVLNGATIAQSTPAAGRGSVGGMSNDLVAQMKEYLAMLSDEGRMNLLDDLWAPYCLHCGRKLEPSETCQCTNDE